MDKGYRRGFIDLYYEILFGSWQSHFQVHLVEDASYLSVSRNHLLGEKVYIGHLFA